MPKWIVLSYNFNASEGAASFHIDDRVEAIAAIAPDSLFISGPLGTQRDGIRHEIVRSASPAGVRYEMRHWVKRNPTPARKVAKTLVSVLLFIPYAIEKIFVPLEARWAWSLPAAWRAIRESLRGRAEVVYSTGGPYCAHIAGWMVSRLTGTPWIAELQDPVGLPELAKGEWDLFWNLRMEKFILRRADLTVWLTDGARERAITLGGDPGRQITLRPWTRWEAKECEPASGKFTFTHLGTLGGSRNLEPILAALGILAKERPELLRDIVFRIGGNITRDILDGARNSPHAEVFDFIGKVPRDEAHRIMQRSDALVVIQNSTEVSVTTIPSKVYEYLNSTRPILALPYHNPEIARLLRPEDRAAEADDPRAVADAIAGLYDAGRRSATPAGRGPETAVAELRAKLAPSA